MAWYPRLDDIKNWLERDRWQALQKYLERLISLDGRAGGQGITSATELDESLGIGVSPPEAKLHVKGASYPVAMVHRTTTVTAGFQSGLRLRTTTTGSAADGFGGAINFEMEDAETSGQNIVGRVGALRDGADNSGRIELVSVSSGAMTTALSCRANLDVEISAGNLSILTAGKGLKIKEGAGATSGTATLVAGTVVVNTTAVTADSRIQLTGQVNGVAGALRVSARTAGTSFTITSSNAGDAGAVAWLIIEPA